MSIAMERCVYVYAENNDDCIKSLTKIILRNSLQENVCLLYTLGFAFEQVHPQTVAKYCVN